MCVCCILRLKKRSCVTERCREGVWEVRSCHSAPEELRKKIVGRKQREREMERGVQGKLGGVFAPVCNESSEPSACSSYEYSLNLSSKHHPFAIFHNLLHSAHTQSVQCIHTERCKSRKLLVKMLLFLYKCV